MFAAFCIISGLLSREFGDGGEYIDVPMTDVVASFSQSISSQALTGLDTRPRAIVLTGEYTCYDVYETADGEFITFAAFEAKFWEAFYDDIERRDLIDFEGISYLEQSSQRHASEQS